MRGQDRVNILMVDDHPAKLLTYEAMLADLGENLIKATSSSEALRHLLKSDIAVILMDVNMPDMDGFEIADIIRQHPRFEHIAILFISAIHLTDVDRLKGYQRGAVDYISVPVVPDVLRAKVGIFVDLFRKTRQLESLNRTLEQRVLERTEKLWESEGQFRTLANSIPQLAWMAAPDGSVFWHNQRWYDYTGASFQEMENNGWLKYIDPAHTERVTAGIRMSQETGNEWEDTHPILDGEGRHRWFLFRAVPIRDSHQRIVRWFGTATDVTDQIEAEEKIKDLNRALKQQITELETIMQVLPVGLGLAQDPECRFVAGNPALCAMLGANQGDNLSKSGEGTDSLLFEVFQNNERVPPEQLPMQKAASTRAPVGSSELELRFQGERVVHVVVSASPLFDDSGNVRGAVGVHFDISQRKAMEKLLRERADLIDLAPEAIMVRDQKGLAQYWNSGPRRFMVGPVRKCSTAMCIRLWILGSPCLFRISRPHWPPQASGKVM